MKLQNILPAIALGILLAAVGIIPVEAMDTDVYLHTQSTATSGDPNVLIILDNSGSMNECPDGSTNCSRPISYDHTIDYCNSATLDSATGVTGAGAAVPANCSSYANRIYYIANGQGTPALTSSQWFTPSKNNCFKSSSSLNSPGYYTGDYIAYWNGAKWAMLLDGGGIADSGITYVDCANDNYNRRRNSTADGAALSDGKSPAGSGSTPYISGTSSLFSYSGSRLSLYSSNYLAFLNNYVLASTGGTKIQVAKQAVIDLINANKSVRFGLMVFNDNNGGGGGDTCLSANCSGGRVIFRVDDMDAQRRADMASVVSQIQAQYNTPLAETLYEAYRYYGGKTLYFGNDQYPEAPARDLTAETYTTQSTAINPPYDTTTTDALGNTVYVQPSSETYTAPTEFSCQKANIIIVTDGDPTSDTDANSAITNMLTGTTSSSCTGLTPLNSQGQQMTYVDSTGATQPMTAYGSDCLDVLAGWMSQTPVDPSVSSGGVTTYTVGFGTGLSATGYNELYNAATFSGGVMATATSASALNAALNANLAKIQSFATSFSAPSLAINAFNKQFDNDYIYLSLFLPSSSVAWDGNVKKYRLCTNADITAGKCSALTDILDANGNKVTDSAGNFITTPTPQSYWSATPDGATITAGGAGANTPAVASRNMYTYYSSGGSYSGLTSPSSGVAVSTSSSNSFYTAVAASPTLLGLPASATSTDVQNLVNWILGQDSYNTNAPTGQRWSFGDPLHSTVTPVTLGKDASGKPIIKLMVGDNDGAIRMINENTGVEEWSFLPQELYSIQYALSQNGSGTHLNGVDAAPSVWVQDLNNDGIISPGAGDHVYMFVGMRRGGRNIYAFDITPDHTLTSQNDKSATAPKLMWVINGGSGSFAQLGQTWSQPQRVRVRYACPTSGTNVCNDNNPNTDDTKSRPVLVFAGGYDPHQDTAIPAGPDTMGNAIYMVDPLTGSLIWWASGNTGANLVLPQMLYSIPSDLRLVDTDGDGSIDRIYVGDTGGQLWRIDLGTQLGASGNVNGGTSGYLFADVGCGSGVVHLSNGNCPSTTAVQDIRKFFYPPDRAPVGDSVFSSVANYDLITIGSGDREDPLDLLTATRVSPLNSSGNEPVHNRLYAFRDCNYATGAPSMDCASGTVLGSGAVPAALSEANLYDATSNAIGTDTGTTLATDISTLSGDKGWYINLQTQTAMTLPNGLSTTWVGEKVLASTEIFQGTLFATTYMPANTASATNVCQPNTGTGTEYALNALNATAAPGVTTSSGDRAGAVVVGSGIPSQVVIVFRPDGTSGLIDAGNQGGVPTAAQGVTNSSVKRSYWYEE